MPSSFVHIFCCFLLLCLAPLYSLSNPTDLCGVLALGVLLADVRDGKTCKDVVVSSRSLQLEVLRGTIRTRRQTLLELLSLVGVLEDEGVDVL